MEESVLLLIHHSELRNNLMPLVEQGGQLVLPISMLTLGLLAALGGKIMAFGLWGSLDVYFIIGLFGATGVFFRRYWRAIFGSGLAMTAIGLRSRADYRGQEIRWAEVSRFEVAQEGATVHSAKPFVQPLSLSSTAPNYHVFVALSAARVPHVIVEKVADGAASSPGKV